MNILQAPAGGAGRLSTTGSRPLAAFIAAARTVSNWYRHHLSRKELWALDDRMLDDIGLTRGQLLRPHFHGWKQY